MTPEIIDEVQFTRSENFHLGEFIYMGMGKVKEQTVCIAVAYKIDYCIKKALQFEEADVGNTLPVFIKCLKLNFDLKNDYYLFKDYLK